MFRDFIFPKLRFEANRLVAKCLASKFINKNTREYYKRHYSDRKKDFKKLLLTKDLEAVKQAIAKFKTEITSLKRQIVLESMYGYED